VFESKKSRNRDEAYGVLVRAPGSSPLSSDSDWPVPASVPVQVRGFAQAQIFSISGPVSAPLLPSIRCAVRKCGRGASSAQSFGSSITLSVRTSLDETWCDLPWCACTRRSQFSVRAQFGMQPVFFQSTFRNETRN
jgi:hypothetical protein